MDVNVLWWDGVELDSLLRDGDRLKGSCELCNVPSGSMKYGKFLEYLSDYSLITHCAAWS